MTQTPKLLESSNKPNTLHKHVRLRNLRLGRFHATIRWNHSIGKDSLQDIWRFLSASNHIPDLVQRTYVIFLSSFLIKRDSSQTDSLRISVISDNEWLIGSSKTLNPASYFIIIPALFGNSQSSSPSNTSLSPFPHVTFYDNVLAQYTLITKHLHIKHAFAVLGWSMGAAQTYQWATQFPSFMDKIVPFCGSAKTSLHNQVFLEGVKGALVAAKGCVSAGICKGYTNEGEKQWTQKETEVGLKALGRVYAGWGFSQSFYRQRLYESVLGYSDLETYEGSSFPSLPLFRIVSWR